MISVTIHRAFRACATIAGLVYSSTSGIAQSPDVNYRGAIVAAVKAVATPDKPGPIIVSTQFVKDGASLAAGVAADLGGVVRNRSEAIVCEKSASPKGFCRVMGGQFIEIEQITRAENGTDLLVQLRNVQGEGVLHRRTFIVTVSKGNGQWRVTETQLLEIT